MGNWGRGHHPIHGGPEQKSNEEEERLCSCSLSWDIHLLLLSDISALVLGPLDSDWTSTISSSGSQAFRCEMELYHQFSSLQMADHGRSYRFSFSGEPGLTQALKVSYDSKSQPLCMY